MEPIKNEFQLLKALGFGLTAKHSEKKNKTHEELMDLIQLSEERIKGKTKPTNEITEKKMLEIISECVFLMKHHINTWEKVYNRADQITLTKEYYKELAKKACFDAFWTDNKDNKQPKSQLIKLSSLKKPRYENYERMGYILRYWRTNIQNLKRKIHDFELLLSQYKLALSKQDKAHTKPQLVDFRKMFLSIVALIHETLIPLNNNSIQFLQLDKLPDGEDSETVKTFAIEEREERKYLAAKIKETKEYFEENGGYVPYGRVTLNPYTAKQRPHIFNEEIADIIKDLGVEKLIKKLQSINDISKYFEFAESDNDKRKLMKDSSYSIIERVQFFKYKPIPASVCFMLADFLQRTKKLEKENVLDLLNKIGMQRSISKEYKDKKSINLEQYPLKIAFDYAWENLAGRIHNSTIPFSDQQCVDFLQQFGVDINNDNFRLYADLLFVKNNLATLENPKNQPNDGSEFIDNIKRTFENIKLSKENNKHKDVILNWLNKNTEEQKELKKGNAQLFKDYEKAKEKLGQLRGMQKNSCPKYKSLTEEFKNLAIDFGKKFADLRDKLREESELNKITHFGVIVEDSQKDRYILLGKPEDKLIHKFLNNDPNGNLKTYNVKSLTSKALSKIIKNKGAYKAFHSSQVKIDRKEIKQKWQEYQDHGDFINYVKDCFANSPMSKEQKWSEFQCKFDHCQKYEEIEKELDAKAYLLKEQNISLQTIKKLVEQEDCLLLPFVNQDITSKTRERKNQFSKDWDMMFKKDNGYRLHPEFRIFYRQPTPDYPKSGEKRYSRFQMTARLLCEFIPQSDNYISHKQQIKTFNNKDKQEEAVKEFNDKLHHPDNFYVFGIDRGINQLAVLCVLNKEGQIQEGFKIYTRSFDIEKKQWIHELSEKRNILDLSNLRVETTINNEKVLVDLSGIKIKNKEGYQDNRQKIKLKQLAYIRKLQYQMHAAPQRTLAFINKYHTPEDMKKHIQEDIKELITPYKEGVNYSDLPIEKICDMLQQFKQYYDKEDKKSTRELTELDSADELKTGIVANMVGVIAYLLKEYDYKVYISFEDLTRAFGRQKDGLDGRELPHSNEDKTVDFKGQENAALAGLGTYHYFEMQLLRKLFRIQQENKDILHLVPAFRSVDNYEKIVRRDKKSDNDEYVNYPFGIVRFVDPRNTSRKCPNCGEIKKQIITRSKNKITCRKCGFITGNNNHDKIKDNKKDKNLHYITNGDDNGAYHIALKTLKNLKGQ